ncbi:MAG: acetate kinase [Bacteroidales bacterium]|nr:acetate kinase [Bacteroidales bacterium]MDD3010749.1 acetate kinase [Bacteroidales bacterium]MDD3961492.1 acetate kinase [Bacteroidales bacterium]MDY0285702.1 acetate kinase [Bacteroidales bacterium]HPE87416.1 acetate kinase [Bacteroidales bacterium]
MKIVVLNCGSSSIKYQLFEMPEQTVLAKGLVDKIGISGSCIKHQKTGDEKVSFSDAIPDHKTGIQKVLALLTDPVHGCVKSINEIEAVGHRVVHAGEKFNGSVKITGAVIDALKECIHLAPLHNPPNLEGIYAITDVLPNVPQVGVFDTAFHQTMPPVAYLYGLPYEYYEKYAVRRYGFHGSSHRYVSKKACEEIGMDYFTAKIVTCHLGNGSSLAAIKNGQSIDTSMGLTPLEGVMMGTRSGDLDIGAVLSIADLENLSIDDVNVLVNKKSGILGISGLSSDMRDVEIAGEEGHERAMLALEMFAYRVKKYIGAYAAAMGGVDLIVFTGGIGENDTRSRNRIMEGLEFLGVDFDYALSLKVRGDLKVLTHEKSQVKVMVVPTNEELVIASDTYSLVSA